MEPPLVLVTGGKGDLATEIVAQLADHHCQVLAPGRDQLDVADAASVQSYFAEVDGIDLLINNAGLTRDVGHAKITEDAWDQVIDVNLKGAFLCSQAALKKFPRKQGGHIINIGSFSGKSPPIGQTNYAAAKAGVIGLTQSLAREYGKRNVRVNAVLPGFLETKLTAALSDQALDRIRQRHVLGRFNTVLEAAQFIAFLHFSMPHVSGQVFQLDSRI